jgi:hypothetical protein
MFFRISLLLALCQGSSFIFGQASELFMVDLNEVADKYEVSNERYLSAFNQGGYTNQPTFVDLYTLLVSAGKKNDLPNTDIFELNLRSKRITRITKTKDREYSPVISRHDKKMISCVLVEVENNDNQILWQYPLDRSNGGQSLLKGVNQVGYFIELKDDWVAVYEVGTPSKLWLHNRKTGDKKFITANVGRSLQLMQDGMLAYVHKFSDDYWFLKKLNIEDLRSDIIKKTIPGAEDFTLLSDDSIIMGAKSKLYHLDHRGSNTWQEIADLSDMGITNITRVAFNGINQLAIVDQR